MKKIRSLLFLSVAILFSLQVSASYSIQLFYITGTNSSKQLVIANPSQPTNFTASYTLQKIPDNQFDNITVDVIFIDDKAQTISLSTPKTYYGSSLPGNQISETVNAQLPAQKTRGYIYLRIKSTSPQVFEQMSNPIGVTTDTSPDLATIIANLREDIKPKGNMRDIPIHNSVSDLFNDGTIVTFYLCKSRTAGSVDYDYTTNPLANDKYVIRMEFYAFTKPMPGLIPIYRFVRKSNRCAVLTTVRAQDESILEYVNIAFYAYDPGVVRPSRGETPPPGVVGINYVVAAQNADVGFYAVVSPGPDKTSWVYTRVLNTAFATYPAYEVTP